MAEKIQNFKNLSDVASPFNRTKEKHFFLKFILEALYLKIKLIVISSFCKKKTICKLDVKSINLFLNIFKENIFTS